MYAMAVLAIEARPNMTIVKELCFTEEEQCSNICIYLISANIQIVGCDWNGATIMHAVPLDLNYSNPGPLR